MFVPTKEHIRHFLLSEFHNGVNASTTAKFIQSFYRDDSLNERSSRKGFFMFSK